MLGNAPGFIDSHDVVVRVNNYRLVGHATGRRTDVFYSFFGSSIRKTAAELARDGVTLCLCKCPNSQPIESDWHRRHKKMNGVDFRWIYRDRAAWWFCDTFVPDSAEFLADFDLLGRHVPTTGFAAIRKIVACAPKRVYLTGFDFFRSHMHNVTARWRPGRPDDPIRHMPDRELAWLRQNARQYPVSFDRALERLMALPVRSAVA